MPEDHKEHQGHEGHAHAGAPDLPCGCPGSAAQTFEKPGADDGSGTAARPSQLTHWPIQLHLMSPMAEQFHGADLLFSADCVAFSNGDFHRDYLKGRALTIACPKLDQGQETYIEKITALIDEAKINTLTVMIMQVPCCMGLLELAKAAASQASRKVPIKAIIVGLQGDILQEGWVE